MALDLDQTCTAAELAGLLNLTTRRIFQLADEGVLPRATRGRFALVGSIKGYVTYAQELARGRPASNRELALERLALTKAKRILAELEIERFRGQHLPQRPTLRAIETASRIQRDRVLALPAVAEELAAEAGGDAVRLRIGLEQAARTICQDVSDETLRLARELGDGGEGHAG
jgi:hypothetical protein